MIMLVPVKEITLPGGQVKYQCTRCWGTYNTKTQAETVSLTYAPNVGAHRCRARPMISNRKPK